MTHLSPAGDGGGFADLGLHPGLLKALADLGYEEPTPIQREAIPTLLAGRDLLGQAATGTGKTAAFALPALQRLAHDRAAAAAGAVEGAAGAAEGPAGAVEGGPAVLVLVPTRELAEQVSQAFHRYGRDLGVRVLPIYGGQPFARQLQVLARGVDVVVATPGRALDHLRRTTLRLHAVRTVVLDEADEMLDMGFAEDIEAILTETPPHRQTVLFSATLPARIDAIARRHLRNPVRIEIGRAATPAGGPPLVRQSAYVVARPHKPAALGRVLDVEAPAAALVFCRTREEVDQLTETMNGRGYRAEALHGGMSQEQRDRVMGRLRAGTADLVIATDVAARGLDVEQLTHVVNYHLPAGPDAYVHRIGRVGRAGREGVAITLVEPREHRMLRTIEKITGQRIAVEKIPTVADLRARRLELTRAALQESLLSDDLDHFRVVVETLTDEFDPMDVALAAVKLAHEASAGEGVGEEEEIPQVAGAGRRPPAARGVPAGDGLARWFLGVGRRAGIRPQDLVGAIAGESRLSGRDIGAIEISDRFSLVEVPESAVDDVIAALRRSTIKGKKATVRRERPSGGAPHRPR